MEMDNKTPKSPESHDPEKGPSQGLPEEQVLEQKLENDLSSDEIADEQSLETEVQVQKEKYVRLLAEMENLRKRHERQLSDIQKYAVESIMKELLPVLDSFEQALNGQEPDNSEFHKGMFLVRDQLGQSLQRNGLKVIESLGQPFDPNFHQAIKTTKVEGQSEELVLSEFQKGYTLNERLIRASMVEVSTGD